MWLINPDEILKKMESVLDMQDVYLPIHFMDFVVSEIPMIDAEPVVRCKDCIYYAERHYENSGEPEYIKGCCKYSRCLIRPDDFCSFGERKDGHTLKGQDDGKNV